MGGNKGIRSQDTSCSASQAHSHYSEKPGLPKAKQYPLGIAAAPLRCLLSKSSLSNSLSHWVLTYSMFVRQDCYTSWGLIILTELCQALSELLYSFLSFSALPWVPGRPQKQWEAWVSSVWGGPWKTHRARDTGNRVLLMLLPKEHSYPKYTESAVGSQAALLSATISES